MMIHFRPPIHHVHLMVLSSVNFQQKNRLIAIFQPIILWIRVLIFLAVNPNDLRRCLQNWAIFDGDISLQIGICQIGYLYY